MLNEVALVKFPNVFFRTLDMNEKYPDGESPEDFYERIKVWFDEFIKVHQNDKDNILIVTHGGVINVIYHLIKNIKWSNKSSIVKLKQCEYIENCIIISVFLQRLKKVIFEMFSFH